MKKYVTLCASLGCAGLTIHSAAAASLGDFLKSPTADSPWDITGAASFGLTRGNSETLTYALQGLATYKEGDNEGFIGADLLYSENDGEASTDSFRIFGQYNRLVTDRLYYGVNASYLTDNISDIDYRIDLGLGLGYYFIKNERTSLSFEVSPGLAWENQGGDSRSFVTVRFLERFEHQLSDRSKIWQTASFTPSIDDFSDYLFTAEVGIDTKLSDHWALRTSARYLYDSTPATGSQRDDTSLLMGLSYALGGSTDSATSIQPGSGGTEAIQSGWSSTAALGLAYSTGNAENLAVTLAFDSAYREASREMFFSGAYTYAEDDGDKSVDALRGSAQYNYLLGDRTYVGSGVGLLRDELSDIDYRITPAVTLGHYFIKNDEMTLSLEAGPAYTFESAGGETDNYFSIVAAEKFTWEISDRVTFKQSLSGIFDPSDTDNYTLQASAYLDTEITENLSWRVAAGWAYDNVPALGRSENDTSLTTGISVKF